MTEPAPDGAVWAYIDQLRGQIDTLQLEVDWLRDRLTVFENAGVRVHLNRDEGG